MKLPDVNVLIGAFRPDSPHHRICRKWLTRVIETEPRFGVSPLALSALVRITTGFRTATDPSTLDDAFNFSDALIQQPNCQLVQPGQHHWPIFRQLILDTDTRGKRVTDAWFAALAIEWGCEWITLDRDFARFPGLRWSMPTI